MSRWIREKDDFRRAPSSTFLSVSEDIFASVTLRAPPSIRCTYRCQAAIKVIIMNDHNVLW